MNGKNNPLEIAKKYEGQIKAVIAAKFNLSENDIELLLDRTNGAYFSREEAGTLCCFAVGIKSGLLYLAAIRLNEKGEYSGEVKVGIVA